MAPDQRNPYRWTGTDIEVHVPRAALLADVRRELLSGRGSGYVLGATGMGKSVFLRVLRDELRSVPGVEVLLFPDAPRGGTREHLHDDLVEKLVATCGDGEDKLVAALKAGRVRTDARRAIETYLEGRPDVQALVLLYDELDDYADEAGHGKQWIKSLESTRKDNSRRVKLFAAGGLRLFSVGDSLASPFLSRTRRFLMPPFDMDGVRLLAQPLIERRGGPLPEGLLAQILLTSGGNAALVTYGLQEMWDGAPDVVEIYERFRREDGGFLRRIRRAVADKRVSETPARLWSAILHGQGALSQQRAEEIVADDDALAMEIADVIALLQSAGLISLESPTNADPILVRAVPGLLNFKPRTKVKERPTLRAQLVEDLQRILGLLHSMTLDFFHRGEIAQEGLFSAFIASNLRSRGWSSAERESVLGAGHADVTAIHSRFPAEVAVIQVKVWGHNHAGAHEQVARHWSERVTAGAAVMIDTRRDVEGWRDEYERACLDRQARCTWQKITGPLFAHAVAASTLPSGSGIEVDHILLHLQRAPVAKCREVSVPDNSMGLLGQESIRSVHIAAVNLGLPRAALLSHLDPAFVGSLPELSTPASQLLSDLGELNRTAQLADGSVPLKVWLENARALSAGRLEGDAFVRALKALAGGGRVTAR